MHHNITAGTVRLAELLARPGSQAELARALGRSRQLIHAWVTGRSRPSPIDRVRIERVTGIPADSWLTAGERRLIA